MTWHDIWTIVTDVIRIATPFVIWWLGTQHHVVERVSNTHWV
jgi:hypothetical protein